MITVYLHGMRFNIEKLRIEMEKEYGNSLSKLMMARIRGSLSKHYSVTDILTNKETAHKYIDSDFDEDDLQLEIKRLIKQEQSNHEKIVLGWNLVKRETR